jgi:hypothetical protein
MTEQTPKRLVWRLQPTVWVANRRTGFNMDRLGSKVFIGRGSPLGNPHRMRDQTPRERARVITNYFFLFPLCKEWVQAYKELETRFMQGESLILVCFCSPKLCHGDYIATKLMNHLGTESLNSLWGNLRLHYRRREKPQ